MLRHTFIHLPGIGLHRERKLWEQGILDWDRFLDAAASGVLTKKMRESAVPLVRKSLEAIAAGDPRFFHANLPTRESWRLYTEFAERACFLDIETTGLSADYDKVTTIGALGGGKLALFVQGVNLDQFPAYIAQFPLLVTFNGSQFDVPFLRTHFPRPGWTMPTSTYGSSFIRLAIGRSQGGRAKPGALPRSGDPGRGWKRGRAAVAPLPAR